MFDDMHRIEEDLHQYLPLLLLRLNPREIFRVVLRRKENEERDIYRLFKCFFKPCPKDFINLKIVFIGK
jgi:hypothetical protein